MAKKIQRQQDSFAKDDTVYDPISKREGTVADVLENGDVLVKWHSGVSQESLMMPFELELR